MRLSEIGVEHQRSTSGIERLWGRDDLPDALAHYVALVREFNPEGQLEQYPGSPAFAQMLLDHPIPVPRTLN